MLLLGCSLCIDRALQSRLALQTAPTLSRSPSLSRLPRRPVLPAVRPDHADRYPIIVTRHLVQLTCRLTEKFPAFQVPHRPAAS
jgi:hypothetical protein